MVDCLDEKADRLAVFVCSASLTVGGGHIMRCMTLASRLSSSGWGCVLAVNPEAIQVVPKLKESGFELVVLPEIACTEDLAGRFSKGAELLVVDHYGLDAVFELSCRTWAKTIMVVDDLADRPHECDLLLDTTPGRTALSYKALVAEGCRFLFGPEYALLRDRFAMLRPLALARRNQAKVERILVSFGLTDPAGVTARAVKGIIQSGSSAGVHVVLSPEAPDYALVARLAQDNDKVRVFEHVDDMAELMAHADLALGAAGTTSWERCCLGLPTVLMALADNQELNAKELEAAGAALDLGPAGRVEAADVARAVAHIAGDDAALRAMSQAGADLCDGLGSFRVALAVHPPAQAGDGGLVTMRPARAGDVELMFEWQRHPETRRFARRPEPPSWDEHEAWFLAKEYDQECELLMILYEGREAGVFRLDRLENGAWEVSIVVAPELRGRRIGAAALSFADGFWAHEEMRAEILPGNEASRRMFSAAGYEKAGETIYVRER